MKEIVKIMFFLAFPLSLVAQNPVPNHDESKVPSYTLPDPLVFNDGSKVINKNDWDKRRNEIFKLFENEVYGISPEWHGKLEIFKTSRNENAFEGLATRKEVMVKIKNGDKELNISLLIYLPHSAKPVPVFIGYNFYGNHTISQESDIMISPSWVRNKQEYGITENKATEATRGVEASKWQVKEILSRGYGLVTMYYGDIDPDFDDGFKNGVHGLFSQERDSSSWGSISAWAWGLSRAMDYLETDREIDTKKVIVMGHSRLGKTALWAGACDKRFAIVISVESGCGGAKISRRIFGETVYMINKGFTHWFCDNFNKYSNKEETLPIDQHELIALIAPRPVYVASAEEDLNCDPKGEFLSCVAASPVYELLGKKGFPLKEMPSVNHPVIGYIGYHIRPGTHNVMLYDWQCFLDFADFHFKKKNIQ